MESYQAELIVEGWRDGAGLVSRGPKWLLGFGPVTAEEAKPHCGYRRRLSDDLWRVQMGGRFLASEGLIYPGGVPFPDEVAGSTIVVASEVWLYVDMEAGRMIGSHWWPEAVRRPVASQPEDDFVHAVAFDSLAEPPPVPRLQGYVPRLAARKDEGLTVLLSREELRHPVNEMVLLESGALSLRVASALIDPDEIVFHHSPPFELVNLNSLPAAGRQPGRALGPQTWAWPGELLWNAGAWSFDLKAQLPLDRLTEIARTID